MALASVNSESTGDLSNQMEQKILGEGETVEIEISKQGKLEATTSANLVPSISSTETPTNVTLINNGSSANLPEQKILGEGEVVEIRISKQGKLEATTSANLVPPPPISSTETPTNMNSINTVSSTDLPEQKILGEREIVEIEISKQGKLEATTSVNLIPPVSSTETPTNVTLINNVSSTDLPEQKPVEEIAIEEKMDVDDVKVKSFSCLVCNTSVEIHPEDPENINIDYEVLSLIYRVDMTSEDFQNSIKEDEKQGLCTAHQFCKNCVDEIKLLQELDSTMKKAVSKFEVQRDKLASGMLQTFLLNQEVVEEPLPPTKSGFQLEVFEKWKNIYTGKEDKEQEVLWMVKQRESRAAKINKRIAKVKSSLRRTRHNIKDGQEPAKTMAQIQKAMTAAYFTPKVSLLRRKNRLYVKVPITHKTEARFMCPICDKVFSKKDTMTIHTRSHVASTGKLYKCSICDKVCSDRQKLINHRKEHTEDQKNMKCVLCDKTFYRKGALRNHLRTQHQRESFTCTMCDKKFISSFLLKRHISSHSNVDFSVTDMFSCKKCSKSFLKSKDLSDHLRVHDDLTVFGCNYCGKAFSKEKDYRDHLVIHQGGNPYICESEGCGSRFASEALLTSHLKIHRPKEFTCEKCGKACRSRDGLRKHDLTHTGNKPYSCQICDIGFIERKSFDAHMVKHTGKLPYKCNLCQSEEGFKDAKDIRRHKVEHHPNMLPKDKSFPCEFCWHGFASPEAVGEHVAKVHERYKCHLCNRVFKLGDHLRRHMYIHTGEKPYPCTLCSKTFNQESNLKEHMYRHTGTRPHKCPYCPEVGYLRRMHLKEHMMKEHGTDKVPTLPMGRAAHNARKSGNFMVVEEQPDTILGDVYPPSPRSEPQTAAPEVVVQGIGGSSVYLKNLHLANSNAANQQKNNSGQGPLLMRALSGTSSNTAQSPMYVRRIPQNIQTATILGKPGEQNVDIPTINIKSDNSNVRYSIVSESGDPNSQQQYIIFM